LLGCKVDIVTEQGLKDRIRERVLKEAIPLGEMIPNACGIF
jgi:predicted nucleotidyltransferase